MKNILAVMAVALLVPGMVAAQSSITAVYSPLATDFQSCTPGSTPPMYAPSLYTYADGSVGMITQGNCLGRCDSGMGDSLFRWKRDVTTGSWSSANNGLTPSSSGQYLNGQYIPPGAMTGFKEAVNEVPSSDPCGTTTTHSNPTGALGGPATITLNGKLYMAFMKGNGDWWNGEVWWAVSSDYGQTWSVYSSPILYGNYHRGHDADGSCPEGFAGLSMVASTDAGGTWINIYGTYFHPNREKRSFDSGTSAIHYRFRYEPLHTYGFSATKQLLYNGSFINHSGKFVWAYDSGSALSGDIKLDPSLTASSWGNGGYFFTSAATKDNSGTYYILVDHWRTVGESLYYKTSTDAVNWSTVKTIDTTAVSNAYPNKIIVNNALWYGTLSGQTGLYGFLSLGEYCSTTGNVYDGTRILPVKIN